MLKKNKNTLQSLTVATFAVTQPHRPSSAAPAQADSLNVPKLNETDLTCLTGKSFQDTKRHHERKYVGWSCDRFCGQDTNWWEKINIVESEFHPSSSSSWTQQATFLVGYPSYRLTSLELKLSLQSSKGPRCLPRMYPRSFLDKS